MHAEATGLGGSPPLDDLPRLRYAQMVLQESMRLYPPVWVLGRRCVEEFPLGDYRSRRAAW